MSVKLMSAIFETEFRDLSDEEGNVTKASTAKLVLLALADHANDEGEGAYPGLTKMEKKTALSRQGILNTYGALKYNGVIFLVGESKLGTNNYTINTKCFPSISGGQATLLVKPLDHPSQATLLGVVNPLDLNHTLTINKPSLGADAPMPLDWKIAGEHPIAETDLQKGTYDPQKARDVANKIGERKAGAEMLALAFQDARRINLSDDPQKIKGQRKAATDMLASHVTPEHIRQAVKSLVDKGMTVTDLFSVSKTAIDLANPVDAKQPVEVTYDQDGAPESW